MLITDRRGEKQKNIYIKCLSEDCCNKRGVWGGGMMNQNLCFTSNNVQNAFLNVSKQYGVLLVSDVLRQMVRNVCPVVSLFNANVYGASYVYCKYMNGT